MRHLRTRDQGLADIDQHAAAADASPAFNATIGFGSTQQQQQTTTSALNATLASTAQVANNFSMMGSASLRLPAAAATTNAGAGVGEYTDGPGSPLLLGPGAAQPRDVVAAAAAARLSMPPTRRAMTLEVEAPEDLTYAVVKATMRCFEHVAALELERAAAAQKKGKKTKKNATPVLPTKRQFHVDFTEFQSFLKQDPYVLAAFVPFCVRSWLAASPAAVADSGLLRAVAPAPQQQHHTPVASSSGKPQVSGAATPVAASVKTTSPMQSAQASIGGSPVPPLAAKATPAVPVTPDASPVPANVVVSPQAAQ
jgi:hypothetical protein